MAHEVLHVIVRMRTKPESVEAFRQLMLTLQDTTRLEAGCINYRVLQSATDPAEFTTVEEWVDAAAEAAHMTAAHVKAVAPQLGALLADRPDMRRYHAAR